MRKLKTILIIVLLLGVTACASWKQYEYKGAGPQVGEIQTIQLPHDFDSVDLQEYYHIPPARAPQQKINNPGPKEYYPVPDVVHENMHNSKH